MVELIPIHIDKLLAIPRSLNLTQNQSRHIPNVRQEESPSPLTPQVPVANDNL